MEEEKRRRGRPVTPYKVGVMVRITPEAAEILKEKDMLASGSEFTDRYYASDMSDNFIAMTDMLFADTDFKIHLLKLEE